MVTLYPSLIFLTEAGISVNWSRTFKTALFDNLGTISCMSEIRAQF